MRKNLQIKYLCLYLPFWSVNLCERQHGVAKTNGGLNNDGVLLVNTSANQLVVKRFCRNARRAGVRDEMSLPLAKALLPNALVRRHDPLRDFRAIYKLALKCLKISPQVAIDTRLVSGYASDTLDQVPAYYHGLVLNLTGMHRLHRDEPRLADSIIKRLAKSGIEARVAMAPTIGAAWALSRTHSEIKIVSEFREIKEALSYLPVGALRVEPGVVDALRQIGIFKIGELLNLPRKELGLRFGIELTKQIEYALGESDERLVTIHPRAIIRRAQRFETPILSQESIKIAILSLLEALFAELNEKNKRAGSFHIWLNGYGLERPIEREISLNSATKDLKHAVTILTPLIEKFHAPNGIQEIRLTAKTTQFNINEQSDYLIPAQISASSRAVSQLVNNLVARLGKNRVNKLSIESSHIPERSYKFTPIEKNFKSELKILTLPVDLKNDRPPLIFKRPESITAVSLLPDKPPSWIKWKNRGLMIRYAQGPERIGNEWWQNIWQEDAAVSGNSERRSDADMQRDYFKLQDQFGRWLWVYRDLKSREWFVQGVWF